MSCPSPATVDYGVPPPVGDKYADTVRRCVESLRKHHADSALWEKQAEEEGIACYRATAGFGGRSDGVIPFPVK